MFKILKYLTPLILIILLASMAAFGVEDYGNVGPTTNFGYDIGISDEIIAEGSTADDFETTISFTDPTGDRTITVPDSDQTIGTSTSLSPAIITGLDADTLAGADLFLFYDDTGGDLNKITWTNIMGSITVLGGITGAIATPTNISMTGELDITGVNAVIDLNPAQVGTVQIINITPSAILTTSEAMWEGIFINGDALDPSGDDIGIYGVSIDFSGISPTGTGDHSDGYKVIMAGITEDALHIENGKIKIEGNIPSTPIAIFTGIDFRYDVHDMDSTSMLHAIDVAVAEGVPAGDIVAIGTHSQVDVIHQHVGLFTTPDQSGADSFAGIYDDSTSDYTAGIDTVEMFDANSDAIWLGDSATFSELEVDMSSDATRTISPTFWYWKATDWEQFYPADDTDGFQHSGLIRWMASDLTGWSSADPAIGEGETGYWVKVVRTANADPGTPTAQTIKTGLITLYSWDKTGDLVTKDIDATSLMLDTALAPAEGGTGVANGANNTITFTGNYTLGLTLTANTSITLPTSGIIVSDNNPVTDLEGTGLSIAGGTLNWAVPNESIDSDAYIDGSIDHEHLAPDVITGWAADTLADADTFLFHDDTGGDLNKITWANLVGSITIPNNAYTTDKLSVFAATSSLEFKGVISDETGSGKVVFENTPTLITPELGEATATSINFGDTTLDHYEEGSWTPALKFGGNDNNITYTTQTGLYTRIGRQITITGYMVLSAKGDSTGNARVYGLPFTSDNADGAFASISLRLEKITFADVFQASIYKNTSYINLAELTKAGVHSYLTQDDFIDNSVIMFGATYFTD